MQAYNENSSTIIAILLLWWQYNYSMCASGLDKNDWDNQNIYTVQ